MSSVKVPVSPQSQIRTMTLLPADDNADFTTETRHAPPSHSLTKIESFSLLLEHGIQKFESREFEAGDYKWMLIIDLSEDDISADLAMAETSSLPVDWEINAFFSICLFNHILDSYTCFRGKVHRFNKINSKWGLSQFISKKSLTDPSNGFLVDDKCVFGAEVFLIKSQRVMECVSMLEVTDPYKRNWTISNFSKLGEVWTSEEFTEGGYRWKIKLYPNGHGKEKGRNVSIFLESVDSKGFAPHERLKASVCTRIKNQRGREHSFMKNFSHWFTCKDNWGSSASLPIRDVRDSSKGFISVFDTCSLEMEISIQAVAGDAL